MPGGGGGAFETHLPHIVPTLDRRFPPCVTMDGEIVKLYCKFVLAWPTQMISVYKENRPLVTIEPIEFEK